MNCPEVVEWMHRHIDHDLSEEETAQMFEHFRHCKDCTALFSRLNRLSTELEQLSDVTPRFSLVDAIMPQLDAIDKSRQEEVSTSEVLEPVRADSGLNHTKKRTTSWRSRFNGRAIVGVVAAAALLGVFINNYEPKTVSNAEMEMVPTTEQLSTLDKPATELSEIQAQANVPLAEEKQSPADQATSGKQSSPDKKTSSSSGSEHVKGADMQSSSQGQSHESGDKTSKTIASSSADSNDDQNSKSVALSGVNGNAGTPIQDTSKGITSTPDHQVASSTDHTQSVTRNKGTVPKSSDEQTKSGPKTTQPSDKMYGIAAFNPQSWSSPDDKFVAVIEEGQLNFYSISVNADNTESRKLIATNTILGEWIQGSWSEDSTVFTYETKQEDTVTQYKYQIPSDPQ